MMELRRERMSTQGIVECFFNHEQETAYVHPLAFPFVVVYLAEYSSETCVMLASFY